jgi:phage terminase large subunit
MIGGQKEDNQNTLTALDVFISKKSGQIELENLFSNKKAKLAWQYLTDDSTEEILYGGAKGGMKTTLMANFMIEMCMQYEGIRCIVARKELTDLKTTTLNTFWDVLSRRNSKKDIDFEYNGSDHKITFKNGSEILFTYVKPDPSDPDYHRLGGYESTFVGIDEVVQIPKKAMLALKGSLRYKHEKYSLMPKILLTCNPSNNWVKDRYYTPFVNKTLEDEKKFIIALPEDNPFLPAAYVRILEGYDELDRQRLKYGNWDYEDDENNLYTQDQVDDVFTNSFVEPGEKYLTADIALYGSDKLVVGIWSGWRLEKIIVSEKLEADEVESLMRKLITENKIRLSNVVYDADGLGSFLRGYLKGANPFHNGSKALNNENYQNLRSQCYYKLATFINYIYIEDHKKIEYIKQELRQVKRTNIDQDKKLAIVSKDIIKRNIGRSPDFADMIMMRCFFELKTKQERIKTTLI